MAILNSSQFQGSNKLWRWQNCYNFLIFKIFSMRKIFKFCNLKHFNHRKNLKDWEIVTIWSNQIISTICLKVEIVKNLKLPQLGVVLWCILNSCINLLNMNKKMSLFIVTWIYLYIFYALCEPGKNRYFPIKLVFHLIFHKNHNFFAVLKKWKPKKNKKFYQILIVGIWVTRGEYRINKY